MENAGYLFVPPRQESFRSVSASEFNVLMVARKEVGQIDRLFIGGARLAMKQQTSFIGQNSLSIKAC
jgi:hypothetical protein